MNRFHKTVSGLLFNQFCDISIADSKAVADHLRTQGGILVMFFNK